MTDKSNSKRAQLNLRMDGRGELLDAAKETAKARGQTLTEFVILALEAAVYGTAPQPNQQLDVRLDRLDEMVDKAVEEKLQERLAGIEERLGKLSA